MSLAILSIDGGGIRGLVPVRVLAYLEELAGRPIAELFDLIAGTSTGGIITYALTQPGSDGRAARSAERLARLYHEEAPRIFHRSLLHRIRTADGIMGPKYPIDGLRDALTEYLGDTPIRESLTRTMVPTYNTAEPGPRFFKSYDEKDAGFLMADVAIATSAAPSYFPPHRIGDLSLFDGGLFAANPTREAYFELLPFVEPGGEMLVFSLGTGSEAESSSWERARRKGPIGLLRDLGLISWILDGQSDAANHNMKRAPRCTYVRLQYEAPPDLGKIDDASAHNLAILEREAARLIEQHRSVLRDVAQDLAARNDARRA